MRWTQQEINLESGSVPVLRMEHLLYRLAVLREEVEAWANWFGQRDGLAYQEQADEVARALDDGQADMQRLVMAMVDDLAESQSVPNDNDYPKEVV